MAHGESTGTAITPVTSATRLTRADDHILAVRYLLAAAIAVIAGVMGYQALAELNARGHIADQWRWLWPAIFVGPELSGALAVIAAQRRQQGAVWSWFLLVTATAVSVAANVWAAPPDPLSRTVHGIVPIVGFVQIKDICNGIRDRLAAVTAAGPVPAAVTAPAPAASGPAAVPRVITVPVREPHAVPPRPAAPPAAAPKTPAPPRTPKSRPRRTAKTRVGDIALARHAKQIRPHVEANPKITGKQIGELLGTNDSYGRRVKRAVTG
jgi:hypothetical protein